MWSEGAISIPASHAEKTTIIHYKIETNTEPSKYGINNGLITRMLLKDGDKIVANYDSAWEVYPINEAANIATCILLMEHNGGDK